MDLICDAACPWPCGAAGWRRFALDNSAPVKTGAFFLPQSDAVVDAQSGLRGDLVCCVGSCQRCKCSGNSPWCSGWRRGRRSGGRPSRCRSGRCRGSGYRHGQWNSGSAAGSRSRCEHDHRFWRHIRSTSKSHGKEVRGRLRRVRFSPGFGRGFCLSSEDGPRAFFPAPGASAGRALTLSKQPIRYSWANAQRQPECNAPWSSP